MSCDICATDVLCMRHVLAFFLKGGGKAGSRHGARDGAGSEKGCCKGRSWLGIIIHQHHLSSFNHTQARADLNLTSRASPGTAGSAHRMCCLCLPVCLCACVSEGGIERGKGGGMS